MERDIFYMKLALKLARRGGKHVRPNPMVGAVIVKNNRIIGQGYHHRVGAEHAEILAIKNAGPKVKGAVLYVTLEPCSHYGKTPPCTQAIICAGIKKVIVAAKDPNPLVSGRGIKKLKSAGIKVVTGILEQDARELNEIFFKHITTKYPFTILKMACSLDGKIAARTGDSKWITALPARKFVHRLRSQVDAVMVGVNTVLRDDPCLYPYLIAPRTWSGIRVIVDSRLHLPYKTKIVGEAKRHPVIVATTRLAPRRKIKKLKDKGVEFIFTQGVLSYGAKPKRGQVDLKVLFRTLGEKGISLVMVEGGPTLAASLLEEKLVDKVLFFIAPKIIGGQDALTAIAGRGVGQVKKSLRLERVKTQRIGEDILIEGYVNYN